MSREIFEKMLDKSAKLGDKFICLSGYLVGDDISEHAGKLSTNIKTKYSQDDLKYFADLLARKATKSQFIKGEIKINGEVIGLTEKQQELAKTYFGLKDLSGQLKKIRALQDLCTEIDEKTLAKEAFFEIDKKGKAIPKKDTELLMQLKEGEREKIIAEHKKNLEAINQAIKRIDDQIKKEEKSVEKKEEELKEAKVKTEKAYKQIELDKYYEELKQEADLFSSPQIRAIKEKFETEYKDPKTKDVAIFNATHKLKGLLPRNWELARMPYGKGDEWKRFNALPKEKQTRVLQAKAVYDQLKALTKKEPTVAAFRRFYKHYIPEETDFALEVKEAVKSPHTGIEKIVKGKGTLEEKRMKLESVADVVEGLRKEMGLSAVKKPAPITGKATSKKVQAYSTSLKKTVVKPDFNVTAIPQPSMTRLIEQEYKVFTEETKGKKK